MKNNKNNKIKLLLCLALLGNINLAYADFSGKVIKGGVFVAGTGYLLIVAQHKLSDKALAMINSPLGDVNNKADKLFEELENYDFSQMDEANKNKLLKTIDRLSKNPNLTVVNQSSLEILRNRIASSQNKVSLSEKEKYIDKPNPYVKTEKPVEDLIELPITETNSLKDWLIYTPEGKAIDTSTEFPIVPPRDYEDYLTLKSNSQILADNMGGSQPGKAAHHIVPSTDKNAQDARNILIKHGIDINDSVNGVFLPTKPIPNNNALVHNGRHPKDYSIEVNRIIKYADTNGGKTEVLNALKRVDTALSGGAKSNWYVILKGIQ